MQDILFYQNGYLRDFLENRKIAIKEEVEGQDLDYLLSVSETDYCKYLADKYVLDIPIIKDDEICVHSQKEIDIDVSQDFQRAVFDRSRPAYVKGLAVTVAVPFSGDGELFHYRPTTSSLNPPRGEVIGQEIHLTYKEVKHDAEQLKKNYLGTVNQVKHSLQSTCADVNSFNSQLETLINQVVLQRKKKLLDNQGLVASLGIPIRLRENTPCTYTVPEIQRKVHIQTPKVTTRGFKPEPSLDFKEYENILKMIQDVVLVMERSPEAFANMDEENIRQQILVPLNGQYEGRATGETFNYQGKTDILIRENNKNIFIAECKFWKGEKELIKAINQLLGYTSWRDTKTALIIFNKNKGFSSVVEKITPTVKTHPCFKREISIEGETIFRYVLHRLDDANREITLSILAFNIPTKKTEANE